jgi:uncharacterized membrane protein
VAGAIAYVLGWITGVAMYVLEDDEFVQFHAKQSIALSVVGFAASIGLFVVFFVLGRSPFVGGIFRLLLGLLSPLLGLAGLALTAFLAYKAYEGERYKLPVIGDYVASM